MKNFIICLFLTGASISAGAQSLESINKLLEKQKLTEAKAAIDKAMTNEKNAGNPEYWYYKGRIYNNYSYDTSLSVDVRKQYKEVAFDAFVKTQELDKKDLRMKLESYQSYLDLYYGMTNIGSDYFRLKEFEKSAQTFIRTLDLHKFIYEKGYKYDNINFSAIDTPMILNVGIAAIQAKDEKLAATYFQKLADINVSGKGYELVYESLANYYDQTNDEAALNAILEKGKKFYPANAYIRDIELRRLSASGNTDKLFEGYENMLKADPNNFTTIYNYSIELYNYLYVGESKPANPEPLRVKLTDLLKKSISMDSEINSTTLMSNHLFNAGIDYTIEMDKVEGTKPEAVNKRKELNAAAVKYFDECIPYAEKVLKYYDGLSDIKTSQKAARINILTMLSEIYIFKGNEKKSEEYENLKVKSL